MAEYIEREAAYDTLTGYYHHSTDTQHGALREALNRVPAADVVPVRRGRWKWELANNGWANHICSECGYTENTDIHVRLGYQYCPNCGADMRKPPKEET